MRRIAIYERDELLQGLLREWLNGAGYDLWSSELQRDPAAVDLAIVSIATPKEESDAMLRHVRMLHPQTPVIGLTGRARSGLSSAGAAARALGVERVMAKPLTREELLVAVQDVIHRERGA